MFKILAFLVNIVDCCAYLKGFDGLSDKPESLLLVRQQNAELQILDRQHTNEQQSLKDWSNHKLDMLSTKHTTELQSLAREQSVIFNMELQTLDNLMNSMKQLHSQKRTNLIESHRNELLKVGKTEERSSYEIKLPTTKFCNCAERNDILTCEENCKRDSADFVEKLVRRSIYDFSQVTAEKIVFALKFHGSDGDVVSKILDAVLWMCQKHNEIEPHLNNAGMGVVLLDTMSLHVLNENVMSLGLTVLTAYGTATDKIVESFKQNTALLTPSIINLLKQGLNTVGNTEIVLRTAKFVCNVMKNSPDMYNVMNKSGLLDTMSDVVNDKCKLYNDIAFCDQVRDKFTIASRFEMPICSRDYSMPHQFRNNIKVHPDWAKKSDLGSAVYVRGGSTVSTGSGASHLGDIVCADDCSISEVLDAGSASGIVDSGVSSNSNGGATVFGGSSAGGSKGKLVFSLGTASGSDQRVGKLEYIAGIADTAGCTGGAVISVHGGVSYNSNNCAGVCGGSDASASGTVSVGSGDSLCNGPDCIISDLRAGLSAGSSDNSHGDIVISTNTNRMSEHNAGGSVVIPGNAGDTGIAGGIIGYDSNGDVLIFPRPRANSKKSYKNENLKYSGANVYY